MMVAIYQVISEMLGEVENLREYEKTFERVIENKTNPFKMLDVLRIMKDRYAIAINTNDEEKKNSTMYAFNCQLSAKLKLRSKIFDLYNDKNLFEEIKVEHFPNSNFGRDNKFSE